MNPCRIHDVVIAGGGPAGLSAALLLGRCMRDVILCAADRVDIEASPRGGGFIGHEGCPPSELLRIGRDQLRKFETVTQLATRIDQIQRSIAGFTVRCGDGQIFDTRSLLIASDLVSSLPDIEGAKNFHGTSLHQYPYCDGWEHRGQRLGVLGGDAHAVDLALKLLIWSDRVTLFSNGDHLPGLSRQHLGEKGILIESGVVAALQGQDRQLVRLLMQDGSSVPCEALFFSSPAIHHTDLAARLGCTVKHVGSSAHWPSDGITGIQGLFFAGNPLQATEMAVIGAADGIKAAEAINRWLDEADLSYLAVKQTA